MLVYSELYQTHAARDGNQSQRPIDYAGVFYAHAAQRAMRRCVAARRRSRSTQMGWLCFGRRRSGADGGGGLVDDGGAAGSDAAGSSRGGGRLGVVVVGVAQVGSRLPRSLVVDGGVRPEARGGRGCAHAQRGGGAAAHHRLGVCGLPVAFLEEEGVALEPDAHVRLLVGHHRVDEEGDEQQHVLGGDGDEELGRHRHVADDALARLAQQRRVRPAGDVVELVGRDGDDEAVDQHAYKGREEEQRAPEADALGGDGHRPDRAVGEPQRVGAQPEHGVEQADKGREREGDREHGDVPKLDDDTRVVEHRVVGRERRLLEQRGHGAARARAAAAAGGAAGGRLHPLKLERRVVEAARHARRLCAGHVGAVVHVVANANGMMSDSLGARNC
mmetsp:Transcript_57707/g.125318  ORF Transcript_57707/g.125318 Transcript_57707/m.125318 type:complete len:388 (-) Transcript_57707:145-1308(-)